MNEYIGAVASELLAARLSCQFEIGAPLAHIGNHAVGQGIAVGGNLARACMARA
jgi:hypothetical protein